MELITVAITDALQLESLALLAAGIVIGYIVGVLPGLNRPTALALALPLSYALSPLSAIAFLIGISKGGSAGGATTAILLNTPGEPASAATCFDGYPLARAGKAEKALKVALYSSVFGDLFATIVLIFLAAPLAAYALRIGPVEICAILIFALTFIGALSGNSIIKGLIAGLVGIFLAMVGLERETATARMTFGIPDLMDGMPLVPVAMGVLALSEMFAQLEATAGASSSTNADMLRKGDRNAQSVTFGDMRNLGRTWLRSSLIGTVIGILPGLGATIASFLSYTVAKRAARPGERFGQGEIKGVAAAEAADNAVTASALVPLFALGIPGSVAAAILIGAFMIHGVTPGPLMFETNARLVYGIFAVMLIASVFLLVIGRIGLKVFAQAARIPDHTLCPIVVVLCLLGVLLEGGGMFGVALMVAFGIIGYLMKKLDLSFITFLIGFLLGPMVELSLRQSLILLDGDMSRLVNHPIALAFLALSAFATWRFSRRAGRASAA